MMGPRQEAQAALFYEFSLEEHVPQDHLLRSVDRHLDLSSIRGHLAGFYSHTRRPSVDPELMILMLLVGYCFGIPRTIKVRSQSDPLSWKLPPNRFLGGSPTETRLLPRGLNLRSLEERHARREQSSLTLCWFFQSSNETRRFATRFRGQGG